MDFIVKCYDKTIETRRQQPIVQLIVELQLLELIKIAGYWRITFLLQLIVENNVVSSAYIINLKTLLAFIISLIAYR